MKFFDFLKDCKVQKIIGSDIPKVTVKCTFCGADNTITKGYSGICEYCGSPLQG